MAMNETICWECGRACSHDCPWADSGIPVKGWNAVKNNHEDSYCVIECPLFCKDEPLQNIDTDGAQNLVAGMIRQMVSDYVKGTSQNVPVIERFVRGKHFQALSSIEPERLIKMMREKRKERLQRIMRMSGRT